MTNEHNYKYMMTNTMNTICKYKTKAADDKY